jgi:hypothetical protein
MMVSGEDDRARYESVQEQEQEQSYEMGFNEYHICSTVLQEIVLSDDVEYIESNFDMLLNASKKAAVFRVEISENLGNF